VRKGRGMDARIPYQRPQVVSREPVAGLLLVLDTITSAVTDNTDV